MGRSSGTSILKRQREIKKSERAAQKRARRHGKPVSGFTEPRPTVSVTKTPADDVDPPQGDRDDTA